MRTLLAVFSRNLEPAGALLQRSVLVETSALPQTPGDLTAIIGRIAEPGWHLTGCQPLAYHGEDSLPFVVTGFSPLPVSGGHEPPPRTGWRRWFSRKSAR